MSQEGADPRRTGTDRVAAACFVLFFVAPLTIYLALPPILNAGTAQEECEQIAEDALDADPDDAEARWTRLPSAQWECFVDDELAARLGWYATNGSDESVEVLD